MEHHHDARIAGCNKKAEPLVLSVLANSMCEGLRYSHKVCTRSDRNRENGLQSTGTCEEKRVHKQCQVVVVAQFTLAVTSASDAIDNGFYHSVHTWAVAGERGGGVWGRVRGWFGKEKRTREI